MRERLLEEALHRLLDCPELNLDSIEEETRAAIDAASGVLNHPSSSELAELEHTVVYIGEQVELIRAVLERLCDEVSRMRKQLPKPDRQKSLFARTNESSADRPGSQRA